MKHIIIPKDAEQTLSTFADALAEDTGVRVTIGTNEEVGRIAEEHRYDSYASIVAIGDQKFLSRVQDIATLTIAQSEAVAIGEWGGIFPAQNATNGVCHQNQNYAKLKKLMEFFPSSKLFERFNGKKIYDHEHF